MSASPELATMVAAARQAGSVLMGHFRGAARATLKVSLKGPADFVSTADLESERVLREALLGAYPSYGFFGEERAATGAGATTRFVVDPLDGTTNYLHGIPHFAVSIALERAGRLVAGVVFDPSKGEMFVAEEGRGASLDGVPLRVSGEENLGTAIVGTGIPHGNRPERHAKYLLALARVMKESAGIRRLSSAALDLAYVAAGRMDAFFEEGLSAWDVAAGAIIVREAGGRVTTTRGGDDVLVTGDILATNGRIHARMLELVS
jgi:myo-inositol-1(or 4)-monophosphatase